MLSPGAIREGFVEEAGLEKSLNFRQMGEASWTDHHDLRDEEDVETGLSQKQSSCGSNQSSNMGNWGSRW